MSYFNEEDYHADKESDKALKLYWTLISLLVFILIITCSWYLSQIIKVSKYEETYGIVVSSKLIESRGHKGKTLYNPKITYEYYVDNELYVGNTYDIFNVEKGYQITMDIMLEYSVDKEIKVYVNPNNKHETVLKKDIYPYYLFLMPILTGAIIYWLIILYMYKTGNYYLMFELNKKRLVFAYPTAKGFALFSSLYFTLIYGIIGFTIKYHISWFFYFLWFFLLIVTYGVSYKYKKYNLEFSNEFRDQVIDSEMYKNGIKQQQNFKMKDFNIYSYKRINMLMVISIIVAIIFLNIIVHFIYY